MCVYVVSVEDREKTDQDRRDEATSAPAADEERKPVKNRRGPKKEVPDACMASFLAGLDVYQTKMLVGTDAVCVMFKET